ncbi:drug/metabolite transporter (DMT)-like permease [Desulfohalotomaculum tongense]|uniref:DMT family transporter n=1 Tax=Desulforadius tongensis TaxID=1216062 RepID=UPI001956F681|nr:DMT family transporter [Desulforadius tongensis]MBM7856028.1 drug/metabolite transporter (DMT)-like permease [Desulforadius tongensis]
MMAKQAYPTAASIAVAVIFGLSFLFVKDALLYLHPFQLLGLRFALAALFLTLLAVCGVIKLQVKVSHLPDLLKIAIWQPVLYFLCETYGIKFTSAAEAGIIISLVPMVVTVLAIFILGEKITVRQGACVSAAVAGVILMVLGGSAGETAQSQGHLMGIFFLFGAVLAGGFFNVFSRKAAGEYSPVDITFIMMWLGALVFNAIGLVQSYLTGQLADYFKAVQHLPVIADLLYLGVLSSVLGFFLLNYSLSHLPAARVAVFLNLIPVVAVLAAVLFCGEQLGIRQMAGGILILFGVWGTNCFAEKTEKAL